MITLTLVGALAVVIGSSWALTGFFSMVALLPLAAWIGLARPQAVDVRGVISMFAINVTAGLGFFAAIMLTEALWSGATGQEMDSVELAVVAAGCSFLLEPVRRQLGLVSDELLFGIRPDPLAAAGSLASSIGGDPADALDAVRTSLVLPYAALKVEGAPLTESGLATDHIALLPLSLNGQPVGELTVGSRTGDLRLPGRQRQPASASPGRCLRKRRGPMPWRAVCRKSARWRRTHARTSGSGCGVTFMTDSGRDLQRSRSASEPRS